MPERPSLAFVLTLAVAVLLPCGDTRAQRRARGDEPRQDPAAIIAAREAREAAARREALARALEAWADGFEGGSFALPGPVSVSGGNPTYVHHGRRAGALDRKNPGNHLSSLYRLMAEAERDIDEPLAAAMLRIASVGIDQGVYQAELSQVRDLGHWTLARSEDRDVWHHVLRLAAGDRAPWEAEDEDARTRAAGMQVAALRLLGERNLPVFRGTVEAQLTHADSRVRLAAAEAVRRMGRPGSLLTVARLLRDETHPIVASALVQAGRKMVADLGEAVDPALREELVRAAVSGLGLHGWRYDLEAIAFAESWPYREVVPILILTLERAGHPERDQLLAKVGRRSSLRVRRRAWQALQRIVGTLIPEDDPDGWREFWAREGDRIVLRSGGDVAAVETRATFYGIPIEGSEVGFLIDTSGSMDNAVIGAPVTGPRQSRREDVPTRISMAKEQIVQAVQHMDPEMRYHVFTFADECLIWNERAVPPTPAANRQLAQILGRFDASGGTNLWDGLEEVLAADKQVFGQVSENPIDELFVLSDGLPTRGETDEARILEMVRRANRYQNIKINVVFTGQGTGAELLRELAAQNGGAFVQR